MRTEGRERGKEREGGREGILGRKKKGRQKLSFINETGLMEGSKYLPFGLVEIW